MHTDHSGDCATPVDVLLQTARDRGLGAIAITDHNEVSGALEARKIAEEMGDIKVIVAEEVKTAEQGEVIGLFLEEKIPKGLTMAETIAEIRAQGGLVYVPHPFDRFHSVPDYEHLLDIVEEIDLLEVFNPRVALTSFNEEAVRFAAKYRIVPAAGSDSHVAQGLGQRAAADPRLRRAGGVPRGDAGRRHHPQAQEPRLRPDPEVPADDGAAEGAETAGAGRETGSRRQAAAAQRRAAGEQVLMQADRRKGAAPASSKSAPMRSIDDEIREKYLERAIRELNQMSREIQECPHCPRGKLMPVLGSGHPQADVFMLKHAPLASEIEEGVAFYGRSGNALMKSFKRLGIDPLVVYGTLCVKCPMRRARPRRLASASAAWSRRWRSCSRRSSSSWASRPCASSTASASPSPARSSSARARSKPSPPPSTPSTSPTSTPHWTKRAPSSASGERSRRSASGTTTCRRTEAVARSAAVVRICLEFLDYRDRLLLLQDWAGLAKGRQMNAYARPSAALLVLAAAAFMALAASASATTVTSPSGTVYTSTMKAASEGTTTLHNSSLGVSVSCTASSVEGKVQNHGSGVTASGSISSLTFTGCGADTVTVLKAGSLEVHDKTGGNNFDGTLTSVGAEITIKNGATGVSCTYTTGTGTDIGTLTGSVSTGGNATLDIESATIPRTGDSILCGSKGQWTGSYKVTTPSTLLVDG